MKKEGTGAEIVRAEIVEPLATVPDRQRAQLDLVHNLVTSAVGKALDDREAR